MTLRGFYMEANKENYNSNNPIIRFGLRFAKAWKTIWSSKLYTFLLLLAFLSIVMIIITVYPAYFNGILHMNTDDILQYYPYVSQFFEKIKSGDLSVYDKNLLIGVSWFSGAYYIPLDPFMWLGLLLSYLLPNYTAYAITNYMRVACGALVFYYFLSRHMSNKVSFIGGLILFIGGTVEAYYVFPIYLGIVFYAPLGMLLVDFVVEKKKYWYFFVPIYTMLVVLHDFYTAYMLLAFICIYFVIKNHILNQFSFFRLGNNIFRNKVFWISFLKFMAMILIGVMMTAFILMPSALYILNESSRKSSESTESLWYFNNVIYISRYRSNLNNTSRHYFTQLINLFLPNEPHRFMLNEAGDYVREHASLYITSGGLIYLVYFFCLRGRMENRLKFWVVLLNIMLCVPLFSMILGLNSQPYVRWFFIPYMINLYASCIAMNKNDFKVGEKYNFIKFIPMAILGLGIILLTYVVLKDPQIFIHMHSDDEMFYPILITAIIFNSIYVILLILAFILQSFKKDRRIIRYLFPITIFAEAIYAGILIFANIDNAGDWDYFAVKTMSSQKDTLESKGYNESDGYRINIYTSYGRGMCNADIAIGNVNFGSYFQSFYNTQINDLLVDFYQYTGDSTSWNKTFNYGYNLTAAPIFNTKYIISDDLINPPTNYYNDLGDDDNGTHYYELADNNPFIVYDEVFDSTSFGYGSRGINYDNYYFIKQAALLNYGYASYVDTLVETYEETTKSKQLIDSYNKLQSAGVTFVDAQSDVRDSVVKYNGTEGINPYFVKFSTPYDENNSEYYVYDLTSTDGKKLLEYDCLNVWPSSYSDRTLDDGWMYLVTKTTDEYGNVNRSFYQGHYNELYSDRIVDENGDKFEISELWVQKNASSTGTGSCYISGFNYDLYDNYLNKQSQYTNKYFSLDKDTMKVKVTMPDGAKARVIKTAYAYSEDWEIVDNNGTNYELIVIDDAFLGIIVPKNVTDVDLTLQYRPAGYYTGLTFAPLGLAIYFIAVTTYVMFYTRKKEKSIRGGF